MKKYITSDKVGEFCQAMSNAGIYVTVDKDNMSIRLCDGSYMFIDIYQKNSFDNLISDILSTEASLQSQRLFDETHPVEEEEQ